MHQVLKYHDLNQSCWAEPALTRKSQKQSSSRWVTISRDHPTENMRYRGKIRFCIS
jgi:hypothetical protein